MTIESDVDLLGLLPEVKAKVEAAKATQSQAVEPQANQPIETI